MNIRRLIPFLILDAYAVALIALGLWTYTQAPPEANARTALIVPALAAVLVAGCGVVTLLGQAKPVLWRVGTAAGIVLALLLALAFAFPASARRAALANYPAARAEWDAANAARTIPVTNDERRAFFVARSSPDHDTTYLVQALWTMTGLSGLAAVLLVFARVGASRS